MIPMAPPIGRLLCVLAAAAACAWVAAGASAATTPKEWVADANAICTNVMLQQRSIPKRMRTVDELTTWLLKQVALERKALEKIAALERPASMRAGAPSCCPREPAGSPARGAPLRPGVGAN